MRGYAEDIIVKKGLPELDINFILKPFTPSDPIKKCGRCWTHKTRG